MQEIPSKIDSKFRFVLIASERAEQMMRGGTTEDRYRRAEAQSRRDS